MDYLDTEPPYVSGFDNHATRGLTCGSSVWSFAFTYSSLT